MFNTTEKRERALGIKLFLKGTRCSSPKCATVRRPSRPGAHGKASRRASSEFGNLLREKQKFQWSYGLREAQMRRVFAQALKNPAITGDTIFSLLERRLDNVVFRMGFGTSRSVGRQMIGHGHIFVNGRRVAVPSYRVRVNDIIAIRKESKGQPLFKDLSTTLAKHEPPSWLSLNHESLEGKVLSLPKDFDKDFDVNLVVDYYSKMVK